MRILAIILFLVNGLVADGQNSVQKFTMYGDVLRTIDAPPGQNTKRESLLILYALPNGNTTEHTMGKKLAEGDDWHFDIQHIKAQTNFIRQELPAKNIIVVYLENSYKSWPQWKTKHREFISETQHVVDTLLSLVKGKKSLYMNGHSGGGRFIF